MKATRKQEKDSARRASTSKARDVLGHSEQERQARKISPQWEWHYRVLLALRERLINGRSELTTDAGERLEPYSMNMADAATDQFDHDLALSRLSAEQDALYEVEEAIGRILDGSYGICLESGKKIPAARLRAIPWTRFAKDVQGRLEKKGIIHDPRLGELRSPHGARAATLAPEPTELEAAQNKMEETEKLKQRTIWQEESVEAEEQPERQRT